MTEIELNQLDEWLESPVFKGKAIKLVRKYLPVGSSILDIGSGNGLFVKQTHEYNN